MMGHADFSHHSDNDMESVKATYYCWGMLLHRFAVVQGVFVLPADGPLVPQNSDWLFYGTCLRR